MNILLVDDDEQSRKALGRFLNEMGHQVTECSNGQQALETYQQDEFPMIFSDIRMPGMSGIELTHAVSCLPYHEFTDVVLCTGFADLHSVIAALRAGVYDYVLKPVNAVELASVVDRVVEHQLLKRENRLLNQDLPEQLREKTEEKTREVEQIKKILAHSNGFNDVGIFSSDMQGWIEEAKAFHPDRSLPVLIEGETGTGKEIFARLIHHGDLDRVNSPAGPFIDLNCATINPNLFESELFGYEAGAFTNAVSRGQKGKLDLAQGGTLFLDEIGEMSLDVQAKLLRVLEERDYYRVGGLKKVATDARIICATNVDMEKRVKNGQFRSDLFYRLRVGHLRIAPLRERRQEIVPLAELFLRDFALRRKKKFNRVSQEAGRMLLAYLWPGNVRELRNLIEIVVFKYDDLELAPAHLVGLLNINDDRPLSPVGKIVLPFPEEGFALKDYNDLIIEKTLAAHGGNHSATARYLGISRRSLLYRLEQRDKPGE